MAANAAIVDEFDVMISYAWKKEKNLVLKIASFFKEKGLKVWIDENELQVGEDLYPEIVDGIKCSKVVIPCISNEYRTSKNCRKELSFAINNLKKEIIFPLYLDNNPKNTDIDFLVATKLYLNLCDRNGKVLAGTVLDEKLAELYYNISNLTGGRPVTSNPVQSSEESNEFNKDEGDNIGFLSKPSLPVESSVEKVEPYVYEQIQENDTEKEITFIKNQDLKGLPYRSLVIKELNNSPIDLVSIWLKQFPIERTINEEPKLLDIDSECQIYICDAVHGGGNAAFTFFQMFKMRKSDKKVKYLKDILLEEKEIFKKAIDILQKYGSDEKISSLTFRDISDLASATTNILSMPDWRFVADGSNLTDIVDACLNSRRQPGVEGKGDAMFNIVIQRFDEYYKVNDFLQAFENDQNTSGFVRKVKGWIRKRAEKNIKERDDEDGNRNGTTPKEESEGHVAGPVEDIEELEDKMGNLSIPEICL